MIGLMVGAVLGRLVPVQAKGKHTDVNLFDIWEDRDASHYHTSQYYKVVFQAAYPPTDPKMTRSIWICEEREQPLIPLRPEPSAAANVAED